MSTQLYLIPQDYDMLIQKTQPLRVEEVLNRGKYCGHRVMHDEEMIRVFDNERAKWRNLRAAETLIYIIEELAEMGEEVFYVGGADFGDNDLAFEPDPYQRLLRRLCDEEDI